MTREDKFLNSNQVRKTKQLFIEYDYLSDKDHAVYTLARSDKEVNGTVYPSLYRYYMETADPTEALFVERYLYDWEQWERICKSPALKDEIELWRNDLRKKVAGQLVSELMQDAFDKGSKTRTSSAKYLLDNVLKQKNTKAGPGRPVNSTKPEADFSKDVVSDLERIRQLKAGTDAK